MRNESNMRQDRQCPICLNQYCRGRRVPTLICSHQHTICKKCLNNMRHNAPKCPFCREPIDFRKTSINQLILDKVERNMEAPHDQDWEVVPANMRVEDRVPPYQPLAQHEEVIPHGGSESQVDREQRDGRASQHENRLQWTITHCIALFPLLLWMSIAVIGLIFGYSPPSQCLDTQIQNPYTSQGKVHYQLTQLRPLFQQIGFIYLFLSLIYFCCILVSQPNFICLNSFCFIITQAFMKFLAINSLQISNTLINASKQIICPSSVYTYFNIVNYSSQAQIFILSCCVFSVFACLMKF